MIFGISSKTELGVDTVVLHGRWSWKGHSLVTLGKPLHIHYSGLLGERALS